MTLTSLVYIDDAGNVVVDGDALVTAVEAPSSGAFVLVPFELRPWNFSPSQTLIAAAAVLRWKFWNDELNCVRYCSGNGNGPSNSLVDFILADPLHLHPLKLMARNGEGCLGTTICDG